MELIIGINKSEFKRLRNQPKEILYEIRRFYFKKPFVVIKQGLTLEEAKAHCNDPKSSCPEEKYFDGYTKM